MANDSILARAEVEHERKSLAELDSKFGGDMKVDCFVAKQSELLNGYTQAVELLERMANLYPYHVEFINDPNCCEQCKSKRDVQQWLASYYAAASPLQPEPSPPQK